MESRRSWSKRALRLCVWRQLYASRLASTVYLAKTLSRLETWFDGNMLETVRIGYAAWRSPCWRRDFDIGRGHLLEFGFGVFTRPHDLHSVACDDDLLFPYFVCGIHFWHRAPGPSWQSSWLCHATKSRLCVFSSIFLMLCVALCESYYARPGNGLVYSLYLGIGRWPFRTCWLLKLAIICSELRLPLRMECT